MKKNNGFTLLELLTSFVVIGLITSIAMSNALSQNPNLKVRADIKMAEQALKKARGIAIKKSCTIKADFSSALANNGNNGGIINIEDSNGNILDSVVLDRNVLFNANSSTLQNNYVSFDYRGEPVNSSGVVSGFNNTNNTVTISYYQGNSVKASKSVTVLPMTGNISE